MQRALLVLALLVGSAAIECNLAGDATQAADASCPEGKSCVEDVKEDETDGYKGQGTYNCQELDKVGEVIFPELDDADDDRELDAVTNLDTSDKTCSKVEGEVPLQNVPETDAFVMGKWQWAPRETVTVAFWPGSSMCPTTAQTAIKRHFATWDNLIGLNFRWLSNGDKSASITVNCQEGGGSWSYLGPGSKSNKPSMNFGWFRKNPGDIQRTTLHEVGHALGLIHEHQSPKSPVAVVSCSDARVTALAKSQGWSISQACSALKRTTDARFSTNYDPASIMLYGGLKYTQNGVSKTTASNSVLSNTDKSNIAAVYPASGTGKAVTMGPKACKDAIPKCAEFKAAGYCTDPRQAFMMRGSCPATCDFCTPDGSKTNFTNPTWCGFAPGRCSVVQDCTCLDGLEKKELKTQSGAVCYRCAGPDEKTEKGVACTAQAGKCTPGDCKCEADGQIKKTFLKSGKSCSRCVNAEEPKTGVCACAAGMCSTGDCKCKPGQKKVEYKTAADKTKMCYRCETICPMMKGFCSESCACPSGMDKVKMGPACYRCQWPFNPIVSTSRCGKTKDDAEAKCGKRCGLIKIANTTVEANCPDGQTCHENLKTDVCERAKQTNNYLSMTGIGPELAAVEAIESITADEEATMNGVSAASASFAVVLAVTVAVHLMH